jgi:hypothetical protein
MSGVPVYQSAVWDQSHTWSFSDEHTVRAKIGYRVRFVTAGQIVGLMYLRHPLDHGAHIAVVTPSDGAAVGGWSMQKPPVETSEPEFASWHKLYLHPRVPVVTDHFYNVGVYFDTLRYGYETGGTASRITVGDIVIPADGEDAGANSGLYDYGEILGPFGSNTTALFAVDLLFLPNEV